MVMLETCYPQDFNFFYNSSTVILGDSFASLNIPPHCISGQNKFGSSSRQACNSFS